MMRLPDIWEMGMIIRYKSLASILTFHTCHRFVVLASNLVHLYYYMDQAGVVPERTEMLCLPSGEMVSLSSYILYILIVLSSHRWSLLLQAGVLTFNVEKEQILVMGLGQTDRGSCCTSFSFHQISNPWRQLELHSQGICKIFRK